jgi:multiple sugar transport system ATP-binding protein
MANVRLVNLSKAYRPGSFAVRDVSLEVQDKQFVVLVGPSGCGKSTTLRMIAGLEDPTSGDIFIEDERVNDVPPKNRDIAMVFQNYALYPHMTCYRNMAFALQLRRVPKSETDVRVREAAEILGITHLLERKPRELSGGERQRVAVGRAIVRNPKVFLFDEPLSNLDAKLRVQMRAEIGKLHTRLDATMVYVTHDQTEAMTMGDLIVVMHEGVVQQMDDPMRLYDFPANRFVAGFIGSPPMNFVGGTLETIENRREFRAAEWKFPLKDRALYQLRCRPDGPITLGIRPEHVHVDDGFVASHPTTRRRASADVVEPLGSETILYLGVDDIPLIAKTTHRPPRVGESVDLALDLERAHFFDDRSGVNLTL